MLKSHLGEIYKRNENSPQDLYEKKKTSMIHSTSMQVPVAVIIAPNWESTQISHCHSE